MKELFESLPVVVQSQLKAFRVFVSNEENADKVKKEAFGYVKGLRDAGLVSDHQRMTLYIYATQPTKWE